MSDFRIDKITNRVGDAGTQIAGITTFSGTSGMQLPSGPTEYRGGRGRGVFVGGRTPTLLSSCEKIEIATTGDATDFGDVTPVSGNQYSTYGQGSSPTRGVFGGGYYAPGVDVAIIQYITLATRGNSETFGNLTDARRDASGVSSSTRAIFAGGTDSGEPNSSNIIEYVTIATLGDATDFGDMAVGGPGRPAGASNSIRGCFGGGKLSGTSVNTIAYLTISTPGNTIDFGDLTYAGFELGGCSDSHGGLG